MKFRKEKAAQPDAKEVALKGETPWTLRDLYEFLGAQPREFLDQPVGMPSPRYLTHAKICGASFQYSGEHPGPIKHVIFWKWK